MASSSIEINTGTSGTKLDTFTQGTGRHRTAAVIGDATNADTAAVIAPSAAAPATSAALLVIPRADSVNPNGQASMANSVPVVIASDQTAVATKGDVAHDGVDSGNPMKTGGQARTTMPASVADADRANFITDKLGRQVVTMAPREIQISTTVALDNTTTEGDLLAAQGAGIFADLVALYLTNTDSAGGVVELRDVKAGGTLHTFYAPPQQTTPIVMPAGHTIEQGTANSIWGIKTPVALTNLKVTAIFKLDR